MTVAVMYAIGYQFLAAVPVSAQTEVETANDRASVLGPIVALLLISIWIVGFGISIRRARSRRLSVPRHKP